MNDRISIIVPVYNVEKYVGRCMESITAQSYSNIEIIVVDDGTTDNSRNICEKYSNIDPRIKLISQSNQGLSGARNTGLQYVTGDYIAFVDSDDYIEKTYIEELYNSILNTKADITVCGYYNQFDDRTAVFSMPEQLLDGKSATRMLVQDDYMPSYVWNKLYKRALWDNIIFPIGKKFEDTYVMHKVFMRANLVSVIGKPLYHYIRRGDSITGVSKLTNNADTFAGLQARRKDLEGTEFYHTACLTEMQKMRATICEINSLGNEKYLELKIGLREELRNLFSKEKRFISCSQRIKFDLFFMFPRLYTKYYRSKH